MIDEVTGKFTIKQEKCKNDNYRTIAIGEDGKQVGSTFDEEIADRLAAYPEGAVITLDVDKSGRFWDITGARLADKSDQSAAKESKTDAPVTKSTFDNSDLTFFMKYSAMAVAAYLQSSKDYVDTVENTGNAIEAIHKDIVFGAKLLLNQANE